MTGGKQFLSLLNGCRFSEVNLFFKLPLTVNVDLRYLNFCEIFYRLL